MIPKLAPIPEDPEVVALREAEEEKEERIKFWNSLPESERVRIADWFARQFHITLHEDNNIPSMDDDTCYDPLTGNIYHISHYRK